MADELNQPASSQPATPTSVSAGPNGAGKPSEPVATPGMTSSQQNDYYNKTQQLAQERRAFEAERTAWERSRNQGNPSYPQGQPQGYGQPHQPQGYPQVQPQGIPQSPNPNDPAVFKSLVDQFGYDGAAAMHQAFNSITQPVQQQIAHAQQQLVQTQVMTLKSQISAKGKELYGQEWNGKSDQVMDKIMQYGCPLEEAWAIVNANSMRQAGTDAAYQAQQAKEAANVSQQTVAPTNAQPQINSFGDAFGSAWKQHSA